MGAGRGKVRRAQTRRALPVLSKWESAVLDALAKTEKSVGANPKYLGGTPEISTIMIAEGTSKSGEPLNEEVCGAQLERLQEKGLVLSILNTTKIHDSFFVLSRKGREFQGELARQHTEKRTLPTVESVQRVSF